MMKRVGIWLGLCLLFCSTVFAQSDAGKIKGTVKDETGEPVEFATVVIISNGIIKGGATTDENGEYSIAPVEPGTYEVRASFAGNNIVASGIAVGANKTVLVPLAIETGVELKEVTITETIPIDNTTTGGSLSGADVQNIGIRNINSLAAIVPGVYQSDDGDGINMRGGRASSTVYFVDGVKVRGTLNLPQKSIGQLSVITGGTPAEYGDVIGGIISVTTSSPSYDLTGGLELLTSQFLDPYGYNLVGVNLSGPIITKYIDSINYNKPILGFFIAGEGQLEKDQDPAQGGIARLKAANFDDFEQNPLQLDRTGNFFLQRGNFVTPDMVEMSKFKANNQGKTIRVNARLDFQPSENIIVKFGGGYVNENSDRWSNLNSLFAPQGNQLFQGRQYNGWARFQQSFKTTPDSPLQNIFYQLQADWSRYEREFSDPNHKDNLFDYGYIGKFNYDRREVYRYVDPIENADIHNPSISSAGYYMTAGFSPINLSFDPSTSKNPTQANYNNFILDYVKDNGIINPFTGLRDYSIRNMDFLAFYGGLRNGDGVDQIYSLYTGPGTAQRGYSKTSFDQTRITGQASAEVKGHALKLGFEFEQRTERFFGVTARDLWTYMRQLTNRHLSGINQDANSWELVTVNGQFQDTVHAPSFYESLDQSTFDRNLRSQLGLPVDGVDFIVTDNLDPSTFNLSMFSADELLNDGNQYVNYYGYDYTGAKTKRVAAENFFTDLQNRPMNAFAPTYVSGFVQDKFELEDIIFNVGVRIDRFDANQKVLKDGYVLFPTYTASEAKAQGFVVGDNIGDDWVPYMDDATAPTQVLGFRDPSSNIWYNTDGVPTSSASLRSGGEVQPYLKDDKISINSFKDYTPQVIVMPRLSFSFPISGDAVFFAHYDVLAQRPGQTGASTGSLLAGQIADYYYLQNSSTIAVTNPNLRPERTIDYEVGFKQKLNDFMALSISAFYREMRDMLQITNFQDAYPTTYSTYSNIDFGTVKGFTFALNMIRMRNIRMSASYTLQFASGTGSSFTSSRNALSAVDGFTAIRALLPLDFDQRHRLAGNIDYRFYGPDNRGPGIALGGKTIYPFANAGANLTFYMGSGTPYSVNSLANAADVQSGINQNIQLSGTPNGSRLPGQLRFDAKIDKDFVVGGKNKLDGEGNQVKDAKGNAVLKKQYAFNVYCQFLNLLNTKNVLNVYKTSGLPQDDGYLNTGVGQQAINASIDGDAFTYLYTLRMQNPNNYSLPRRIRLGVQLNF
jgi:Carboxypeptidase regulatory-like domain/TonB dependent receptor/TonB-dependent Receptor Plug Domain